MRNYSLKLAVHCALSLRMQLCKNGLKLYASNHFSVYPIILMSFRPSAPQDVSRVDYLGAQASESFFTGLYVSLCLPNEMSRIHTKIRLSARFYTARSSPMKYTATVPCPQCEPIIGPISNSRISALGKTSLSWFITLSAVVLQSECATHIFPA